MKHPRIAEAEVALDEYMNCSDPRAADELLAKALMLDALNRRDGILPMLEKRSPANE